MTLTVRSAMLSAAIGKASGFRSSIGISAGLLTLFDGTKYRRLAVGASVFAIAGEIVMDKLPSTRIPPLAAAVVEDLVALAIGAAVAKEVLA
ncbi:hypothetical protein [Rhodococcus sp. 1168]|uniref:hypothetical protein n=1 Tax=Rhodococcus sp. 1168 TaxID=2018041 RepID=UPI000A0A47BD|nr:hypothetical protein [Rhodococcus sp. 1168]ORI25322.1 hypothetical protein BJI47_02000 [Rhodococcus sp. 1168]